MMNRRAFLGLLAAGAGGLLLPVGQSGWALAAGAGAQPKRLVVVFLRGAVDGLSVVAPWADAEYRGLRPTIALAPAGATDGVIALDGMFGLNPAISPLLPWWRDKRLAFVHACGDPKGERSHFAAQDVMEAGLSGTGRAADGWLNRLAAQLAPGTTAALAVGETVPRILAGPAPVSTLRAGARASQKLPVDRQAVQAAFDRMYAGDDALARAYRQGRDARHALLGELAALDAEMVAADRGAPGAGGFAADANRLARLIARRPEIRLAFLTAGGWDTHVNQGAAKGQLARKLGALAQGLDAFGRGLGSAIDDTVVVVLSEFGRTVAENGNGGTDHGHGNVVWLLGGPVAGGKVHGRWPGLGVSQRFEGRDLAVTTDYRHVLAALLQGHLGLSEAGIRAVLPGMPAGAMRGLIRGA